MKARDGFRKGFHILSGIVLIVCLIRGAFWLFVPLSRPSEQVCDYVEHFVPYGTSWEEAQTLLDHRFPDYHAYPESGLCMSAYTRQVWVGEIGDEPHIAQIGTQAIRVSLGHYQSPLYTSVVAYLAFDDGRLKFIAVEKDIDSL